MDLFKELIPSIMSTKRYLINEDDALKTYNPFLINRAASQHIDSMLYANEMNRYDLDKKLQYDYLFHSIRGQKRPWVTWAKKETSGDIDVVKACYQCSTQKAKEYLRILTTEQLKTIKEKMDIGGKK